MRPCSVRFEEGFAAVLSVQNEFGRFKALANLCLKLSEAFS